MRSAARRSLSFKLLLFAQRLELSLVVRLISGSRGTLGGSEWRSETRVAEVHPLNPAAPSSQVWLKCLTTVAPRESRKRCRVLA